MSDFSPILRVSTRPIPTQGCGILRFDNIDPAAFWDTIALVTTAFHSDAETFEALSYVEVSYDVVMPLVEATCDAVRLIGRLRSRKRVLYGHPEAVRRGLAEAADNVEDRAGEQWPPYKIGGRVAFTGVPSYAVI